jgi:alkylation response protein AidB-like acyl-CoA dehydrogenase
MSDLESLRETLADVLAERCEARSLHAYVNGHSRLDEELWKLAAELGWLGIGIPEADGGLGLGIDGLDVLHREIGSRVVPGSFIATLSAAQWLATIGSTAQKDRYLPQVIAGNLQVAIPADLGGGADSRSGYSFEGDQTFCGPFLGSSSATLALMPIKSATSSRAWALLEIEGLVARSMWDRTREVGDLQTTSIKVASVIDDPTGKHGALLEAYALTALSSDSLGASRSILLQTVEYMKTRSQFERPIGAFQALKHRVANLLAILTSNECLHKQAVISLRTGEDLTLWPALSKAASTDGGVSIAADCVQLHGGIGFTWEYVCHLYLKRARLNQNLLRANWSLRDGAAEALISAIHANRSTATI